MRFLFICLLLQTILLGVVSSSWCVPDLALIGLVFAVIRSPRSWFGYASVVASVMMLWAIRYPGTMFLSYLVVGGLLRIVTNFSPHGIACVLDKTLARLLPWNNPI